MEQNKGPLTDDVSITEIQMQRRLEKQEERCVGWVIFLVFLEVRMKFEAKIFQNILGHIFFF